MKSDDQRVLNCVPSIKTDDDYTIDDALSAGSLEYTDSVPPQKDLREDWWEVDDQGISGACTGYACAYGVLRWHYVKAGKLQAHEKPSARFLWMANKESDGMTKYPTSFLELEGTQTKLALKVAHKFGCVTEDILPMSGGLCTLGRKEFYIAAAKLRISSYHNLGTSLSHWRKWIATNGPILVRMKVDKSWYDAWWSTNGILDTYLPDTVYGGHAVCIVGYTEDSFIIRNSWGSEWGDGGFVYATDGYISQAAKEAYGAIV